MDRLRCRIILIFSSMILFYLIPVKAEDSGRSTQESIFNIMMVSHQLSLYYSKGVATSSPTYTFSSMEGDTIADVRGFTVQFHSQLCMVNFFNRPLIGCGFAFDLSSSEFNGKYNGRMHAWALGYDFRFLMLLRYQFLLGYARNTRPISYYFNEGDHYNEISTPVKSSTTFEYRYGIDLPVLFNKNISISMYRFSKRFGPSRKYYSANRHPHDERYRGNIKGYAFGVTYSFDTVLK